MARPRLGQRLQQGAGTKLTLVSAPAGFGKTTALAEWLAPEVAHGRCVAWLSLHPDDREPVTFWTYVTAALAEAVPGVGADALPLLTSAQPQVHRALAAVLNGLAAAAQEVHLVLDDYHLVDGPEISAAMSFLLEHLPPNVHVLLSTRADPGLPLSRLRALGELVEIRASELRFTPTEVADYLGGVPDLDLAEADIATLEARTEGWVAALQLAALSMQGRDDVAGFVAGFAGNDRFIVDYLVEEVLARQSDPVRRFLVATSVLDRLSGPLCDAVTGQGGGKDTLEALERANLFVVPLDARRHWYRYHHLFADVLATYLVEERPGDVPDLHRRASRWYEQDGQIQPAVRHALAAGDVERAADLIELAVPDLRRTRQDRMLRGWVDDIPDVVVQARPVLAVSFVGAVMSAGDHAGAERRLDELERRLGLADGAAVGHVSSPQPPEVVVVDHGRFAYLPGTIQMYRAALALSRGDVLSAVTHAQLAIDRSAAGDDLTRAGASALCGLAAWRNGDLKTAYSAYSVAVTGMERAGHVADILGCSIVLADILLTQGRLADAHDTYERALRLVDGDTATARPATAVPGMADMHVGLAQLAIERDDLQAATSHLHRSRELGEEAALPQNPYRWRVAMAHVEARRGDLPAALTLLDEAQALYTGDFSPDVRPVAAVRARLLARHGHVDQAMVWVEKQSWSLGEDLSYLHEYEHVTLAAVLLARHTTTGDPSSLRRGTQLLQQLLPAAEAGGRTGTAIEVLVLLTLAHHAAADTRQALKSLERALQLAEPQGYARVFIDGGPLMVDLLQAARAQQEGSPYVDRLITACGGPTPDTAGDAPVPSLGVGRGQRLVDPLSERELEVLRLLATDLAGPAVARHLTISLSTVRTHTRSIYAKLGVNSRRAAVRQAADLGLLRPAPRH